MKRTIGSKIDFQVLSSAEVDRQYGLEPVIDTGEAAGSDSLEQFLDLNCPYCGESVLVRVDLSVGGQSYVEDCQVCCQPMLVVVSAAVGEGGVAVVLERM